MKTNNDHSKTADESGGASEVAARGVLRSIGAFFGLNNYMWSLIYAPIAAQILLFGCVLIGERLLYDGIEVSLAVTAIGIGALGYLRSKKLEVKDGYFKTYFALFLPIILTALQLSVVCALDIFADELSFMPASSDIVWYFVNIVFFFSAIAFAFVSSTTYFLAFVLTTYWAFAVGFFFGLGGKRRQIVNKKPIYLSAVIALAVAAPAIAMISYKSTYMISGDTQKLMSIADDYGSMFDEFIDELIIDRGGESPQEGLREKPTIYFEDNLPKLDGATALYPIYSVAAQAIYKKPENIEYRYFVYEYIACSRTPYAYENLIDKTADLIFVASPPDDRLKPSEASAHVELALTPIGKEAFVFFVNEQNPIKSLTIEQIQKIYTGEITNWREVGGNNEKILAFQRNAYSGSQTTMEEMVMKGLKLKTPLQELVETMGGMLEVVADYRNAKNAIGYSFRYFATVMHKTEGIRLLAINGVEPTAENIKNGSYPLIQKLYIAARKDDISPNAQKLIDWFLSDQGQALIEDVGYVPITRKGEL
ncbi:MAG: substrate-binding domain-containing protein [Helicobacteraceae bacterium]|jgi:phosphate transport system substrate-binding protein|nr:substrate-binding domain-containing protein [Helicobacteraceae bacterium]